MKKHFKKKKEKTSSIRNALKDIQCDFLKAVNFMLSLRVVKLICCI